MNAIIRELRNAANELPAGKRRDVNSKLDRIYLCFRRYGISETQPDRPVPVPVTYEEVVDNTTAFASQRKAIYEYLKRGHTLTSLEAAKMFGASRLPNRIMEIERMTGKAPNRRRITVKNRNGRNVSVCEYWIEAEN